MCIYIYIYSYLFIHLFIFIYSSYTFNFKPCPSFLPGFCPCFFSPTPPSSSSYTFYPSSAPCLKRLYQTLSLLIHSIPILYFFSFYIHISSCNNFWSFRKVFLPYGRILPAEFSSTWLPLQWDIRRSSCSLKATGKK